MNNPDWSFDAVAGRPAGHGQRGRHRPDHRHENYQAYISGMANLFNGTSATSPTSSSPPPSPTALDEALATDYDGTLRFAPAWPSGWDGSGTVAIQGGSKVDVQVQGGTLATAAIQAGQHADA